MSPQPISPAPKFLTHGNHARDTEQTLMSMEIFRSVGCRDQNPRVSVDRVYEATGRQRQTHFKISARPGMYNLYLKSHIVK
jgi:hypothetical protein